MFLAISDCHFASGRKLFVGKRWSGMCYQSWAFDRVGVLTVLFNEPFVIPEDVGWRLFQPLDHGDVCHELPHPFEGRSSRCVSVFQWYVPLEMILLLLPVGWGMSWAGTLVPVPGGTTALLELWLRWPQEKVFANAAVTFSSTGLRGDVFLATWIKMFGPQAKI